MGNSVAATSRKMLYFTAIIWSRIGSLKCVTTISLPRPDVFSKNNYFFLRVRNADDKNQSIDLQ